MKILKNPEDNELIYAINSLEDGNLVVYPTDTIYGIAANVYDDKAIEHLFRAKDRSYDKPVSISLSCVSDISSVAYTNSAIDEIVNLLLPGPYTILLRKRSCISDLLTSGSSIVGVRVPDNPVAQKLADKFPITSTSANISNNSTPDNIDDISKQLKDEVDVYIDCGVTDDNTQSTILDLTGKRVQVLREGKCDEDLMKRILKKNL